jgi:hypothetical protein
MSDTPRTDAHNWKDGDYDDPLHAFYDFACTLERELHAANAIIRQQQLLDEENLRLNDHIKRLEEAGNQMELVLISFQIFSDFRKSDSIRASLNWTKAKEAKP